MWDHHIKNGDMKTAYLVVYFKLGNYRIKEMTKTVDDTTRRNGKQTVLFWKKKLP